jgi:hypothetical protein
VYPLRYIDDAMTQISLILAIAPRYFYGVADKISSSFVISPQSTLRVLYRRQASLVQILSGNASGRYFYYEFL